MAELWEKAGDERDAPDPNDFFLAIRPSTSGRKRRFDSLTSGRSLRFTSTRDPGPCRSTLEDFLAARAVPTYVCCTSRPVIPDASLLENGRRDLAALRHSGSNWVARFGNGAPLEPAQGVGYDSFVPALRGLLADSPLLRRPRRSSSAPDLGHMPN
jgi:hypothetical protein